MVLVKKDQLIKTFLVKDFLIILNSHMLHYIFYNYKIMTWIYEVPS
jgi:hypothetical protein